MVFRWGWILDILVVILPIIFVYSYIQNCYTRASSREVSLKYSKYRSYGDNLIYQFKSRDFTTIQQSLLSSGKGKISLEEIVNFTKKFNLEKSKEIKWKRFKDINHKIDMRGQLILDSGISYPLEITFILKRKIALVKMIKIDSQRLKLHHKNFPLIY